eukprot:3511276-Amphidinium_carterae.1
MQSHFSWLLHAVIKFSNDCHGEVPCLQYLHWEKLLASSTVESDAGIRYRRHRFRCFHYPSMNWVPALQ